MSRRHTLGMPSLFVLTASDTVWNALHSYLLAKRVSRTANLRVRAALPTPCIGVLISQMVGRKASRPVALEHQAGLKQERSGNRPLGKMDMDQKVKSHSLPLVSMNPLTRAGRNSVSSLLSSSMPPNGSEAYNIREHDKWEISEDGTGHLSVTAPSQLPYTDNDDLSRAHNRMNRPVLSGQTMSMLVNAYFDNVAHLFPVVSKGDIMGQTSVSPLLLYAICGVGATLRRFPRDVFAGVRGVINGLLRSNDILSDARFENVQALVSGNIIHLCAIVIDN